MQIINKNVADLVDLPRKVKYKANALTETQAKQLLEVAKNSEIFIPILLGITLGLRRGEVLALRWIDVDFANESVSVCRTSVKYHGKVIYTNPKTEESNRVIKAPSKLIEILVQEIAIQQIADSQNDRIICCKDGLPLSQDVLNKHFKALLKSNNFPDIRFHDLRHTNATIMLKNNIPAKIASERLGHSSIGITMDLYSHVFVEMQNEAADVINTLIKLM
ncbi:MAG: site-specific integrase [Saccharofermentanales bacterium]